MSWACYQDEGDWNAYGILVGKQTYWKQSLRILRKRWKARIKHTDIREMSSEDSSFVLTPQRGSM
jgi:hypothetical protein